MIEPMFALSPSLLGRLAVVLKDRLLKVVEVAKHRVRFGTNKDQLDEPLFSFAVCRPQLNGTLQIGALQNYDLMYWILHFRIRRMNQEVPPENPENLEATERETKCHILRSFFHTVSQKCEKTCMCKKLRIAITSISRHPTVKTLRIFLTTTILIIISIILTLAGFRFIGSIPSLSQSSLDVPFIPNASSTAFWTIANSAFGQAIAGAAFGGAAGFAASIHFAHKDEVRKNTIEMVRHFNSLETVLLRRGAQNFLEEFCNLKEANYEDTLISGMTLQTIFGPRIDFIGALNKEIIKLNDESTTETHPNITQGTNTEIQKITQTAQVITDHDIDRLKRFNQGADQLRGAFAILELMGDMKSMKALDQKVLRETTGGFLEAWIRVFDRPVKNSFAEVNWETSRKGFDNSKSFRANLNRAD